MLLSSRASAKTPLATKNLLEVTDGLRRRPPSKGGDAIHQCPLDAVALCFLLTRALLMTASHSEGSTTIVDGKPIIVYPVYK